MIFFYNIPNILSESAAVVTRELAEKSQVISLNRLEEVARMLPDVQNNLRDMKQNTNDLRRLIVNLDNGMYNYYYYT